LFLFSQMKKERDSIFSPGYLQRYANQRRPSRKLVSSFLRASGSGRSQSPGSGSAGGTGYGSATASTSQTHPASALILVFHGGTVLDVSSELANKAADLATFRSNLEAVSRQHFPGLCSGRLAVRLVSCPTLCPDAITVLNSLSSLDQAADQAADPSSSAGAGPSSNSNSSSSTAAGPSFTAAWPPLGCLPLFAASSPEYADTVTRAILAANQAYAEFLKSPEGSGFSGSVAVVGDAAGSILLYDALCKSEPDMHSHFGSENSIAEDVAELDQLTAPLEEVEVAAERTDHFHFSGGSSSFRSSRSAGHHHLQAPPHRRLSTTSSDLTGPTGRSKNFLEFEVGDCFLLGSPLALVLAFRKYDVILVLISLKMEMNTLF
jgi:hypothetical protein